MKYTKGLSLLLVLTVLSIPFLIAYAAGGRIEGKVTDPKGAAIPEASVSSTTTQDPVGAEQTLRTLGVPIYHDATIDTAQHATSDEQGANAVFTTSATVKQVEYFYQSYPELKMTKANGSTLFSGSLNGVPVTLEVRPNKGKTEIIAQARKS